MLLRVSKLTNRETAVTAYRAYIESILRYGLIIWGNSTNVNKVFIAQKKCIRTVCGIPPDASCHPYFKGLDLLPLPSLYIYEVGIFVYKNKELFKKACDVNSRLKRNPNRLVLSQIPKSEKYNISCVVMCVLIYNKIPNEFKTLNFDLYKYKLYMWLKENSFYHVKQFLN
jgi:hypothetical protein